MSLPAIVASLVTGVFTDYLSGESIDEIHKWQSRKAIHQAADAFLDSDDWKGSFRRYGIADDALDLKQMVDLCDDDGFRQAVTRYFLSYDDPGDREERRGGLLQQWLTAAGAGTPEEWNAASALFEVLCDTFDHTIEECVATPEGKLLYTNLTGYLERRIQQSEERLASVMKEAAGAVGSFAQFLDSTDLMPRSAGKDDGFQYTSDRVAFLGREDELELLHRFCASEERVSWCAVTAKGGSGKSRLAYEFCKELDGQWRVGFLPREFWARKDTFTSWRYAKHLFLVVDYAAERGRELGQWLRELDHCTTLGRKIRVLVLEREGFPEKDGEDRKAGFGSEPVWYADMQKAYSPRDLERLCFPEAYPAYSLPKIDRHHRGRILESFVERSGRQLPEGDRELLLERLDSIDPDLCRPLFLLFLGQAWLDGAEWRTWSQEKLQEYVYTRELGILDRHFGGNANAKALVVRFWTFATAIDGLRLRDPVIRDIPFLCTKELGTQMTLDDFQDHLRAAAGGNDKYDATAYVPDLVGEYFVLMELYERAWRGDAEFIQSFIRCGWNVGANEFLFFLYRCIDDYAGKKYIFTELFDVTSDCTIFRPPEDAELLPAFCKLVVNLSAKQDLAGCQDTVALLQQLHEEYPSDREIALEYAKGLFNLTVEQDLAGCQDTVALLQQLHEEYPGDREIALEYAKGLFNLTVEQDLAGCQDTVALLRQLHEEYPGDREIALVYAKGLINLTTKQDLTGRQDTVALLRQLYEEYLGDREIALVYAQGLFNLTIKQGLAGCQETISLLRQPYVEHPGNREIALAYALGLFKLSTKQDLTGCQDTVALLRQLYEEYPGNREIALAYAQGLFNLTTKQDLTGPQDTVALLRQLYEEYPGNREIALEYAKGLFNLSTVQDLAGCQHTISLLRQLHEEYPGDREIAWVYAKGLFNLTAEQDLAGCQHAVSLILKLHDEYPDDQEIALAYAKGLFNLSTKQDLTGCQDTVALLQQLHEEYLGDREIALVYAQGLVNLTFLQDLTGRQDTVALLRQLHKEYPGNQEIALDYAKGLFNLTTKQDLDAQRDSINELKRLIDLYGDIPEWLVVIRAMETVYPDEMAASVEP